MALNQDSSFNFENPHGNWTLTNCLIICCRQEPRVKQEDRMLGWPCCPSGQLYTKARIDRLAYCPGQEVKISGIVNNESGKQVVGFEAQLVQKVLFKAPESKCQKYIVLYYFYTILPSTFISSSVVNLSIFCNLDQNCLDIDILRSLKSFNRAQN